MKLLNGIVVLSSKYTELLNKVINEFFRSKLIAKGGFYLNVRSLQTTRWHSSLYGRILIIFRGADLVPRGLEVDLYRS